MSSLNECLELLRQLVAIPSQSRQERAHAQAVQAYLRDELGMETTLQHVAGESYNVIGRWQWGRGPGRRKLILGGHLDTVPPTDRWSTDPYRLTQEGDKLRGLGAGDMKGGLAAQLTVLKRLHTQQVRLDADVEFVGLADEERCSIGATAYVQWIRQQGQLPQDTFFLMGEPHFDNIVIGATGKVLLRLETTGRAGHASTPEKGVNAIDCMAALLQAVDGVWGPKYRAGLCGSHCCLKIDSLYPGYSLNIPQRCSCLMNKQLLPQERAEDFVQQVQRLYRQQVGRGSLHITRQVPSYPSYQLPPDEKNVAGLVDYLSQHCARTPELRVNQSVSDGNILFHSLGIPTVLYGPQGVAFHTEGEYLSKRSLETYLEELYGYLMTEYGAGTR